MTEFYFGSVPGFAGSSPLGARVEKLFQSSEKYVEFHRLKPVDRSVTARGRCRVLLSITPYLSPKTSTSEANPGIRFHGKFPLRQMCFLFFMEKTINKVRIHHFCLQVSETSDRNPLNFALDVCAEYSKVFKCGAPRNNPISAGVVP